MSKFRALIESELVDREDGTILDLRTNFLWQKETSNKTYTQEQAKEYCKRLELVGYNDWRLPTIEELMTLINKKYKPTIDPIFECKMDWYWSLSICAIYFSSTWCTNFNSGSIGHIGSHSSCFIRAIHDEVKGEIK